MFDDIRPYLDSEIPDAMQRIASAPEFKLVSQYLFPEIDPAHVAARLTGCTDISSFQHQFMWPAVSSIIKNTTKGVTIEGTDKLNASTSYLYVSNHRDIALDAALLQFLLDGAGLPTSEITFGANLMQGQFVTDIGKSNKMFRVERPTTVTSMRDFLQRSKYLSEYIRHTITEKHESVWIAQRNGRSKDGDDQTDRGLINMFCQSGPKAWTEALAELHLVPIAISYEWEPCDILKAMELHLRESGDPYIKRPGEDLNSILTGIRQQKGRVHLCICDMLSEDDCSSMANLSKGDFTKEVARIIDERIISSYKLFENNFIAWDMLTGNVSDCYTAEQKEAFCSYLAELDKYPDSDALRNIILRMYANPVFNRNKLSEKRDLQ
ncbi:MAG: 1-acyl-sn-glycerol-3-phosphate acyltransferase [Bacteroidales bacterium]|nr:1-acyl-sn-glycerol-3-phosphate acyltransferase [Bacteroidales bacterium]